MKKFAAIGIWLGITAVCLLLGFVFFLALKSNMALKRDLTKIQEELRDAQKASRKLADLEKQAEELHQREEKLKKQVAQQEKKPFGLVRTITGAGTKAGLRNIGFEILALADEGQEVVVDVRELRFQMKFEATFPQLLVFLKELAGLERIVTVKSLEIRRQPERVPYQSVVVTLATYSFPER